MKTKTLWIAGALAVLMGTVGVAQARDFGGAPGMRGGPGGPNLEQMFRDADANRDGLVTQAEVDALSAARFSQADADGDGLLSSAEMQAFAEARREARRAARTDAMIERLDENGDGLLSQEELAARGPGDRFERLLDRLDADEDGALSEGELEEALDRMSARRGHGGFWGRN
jgi:hypothetical protein